jgi:hypothetical protein
MFISIKTEGGGHEDSAKPISQVSHKKTVEPAWSRALHTFNRQPYGGEVVRLMPITMLPMKSITSLRHYLTMTSLQTYCGV